MFACKMTDVNKNLEFSGNFLLFSLYQYNCDHTSLLLLYKKVMNKWAYEPLKKH